MKLEFKDSFLKDIKKLNDKNIKTKIEKAILNVK